MSADRDQQRERMVELHRQWVDSGGDGVGYVDLINFLLDNSVSVELPPEPVVLVGATGTGTVRGERGLTVMRVDRVQVRALAEDRVVWASAVPVQGARLHTAAQVTDFVPFPEPLTADAVGRVVAEVWEGPAWNRVPPASRGDVNCRVWKILAPYVANGGGA